MSLEEGDSEVDFRMGEDPEGDVQDGMPGDDLPGWYKMARSTTPAVTPAEVGQELDIGAEWWEHLLCMGHKASGTEGTEAWMHGVMALILLSMEFIEEPDGESDGFFGDDNEAGGGDPASELSDQEDDMSGAVYDGPQ